MAGLVPAIPVFPAVASAGRNHKERQKEHAMMAPIALSPALPRTDADTSGALRTLLIGLTAFLTVVDLFATQAILPALTRAYGTTPAMMSFAVNASTIGMAISGLGVGLMGRNIDRRRGIMLSLAVLSVPTLLLASMPSLPVFALLRVMQGLCMAAAFTLTLAYLGEISFGRATASAFAAYITGNVASNLFGRLLSAAVADHLGLASNFYTFAALNLCGGLLVHLTIRRQPAKSATMSPTGVVSAWFDNLRDPSMRAAFGIGFCILFAFIGTFTYVNFVLVRQPFDLGMMELGFVYFVFLPSVVTTPLAGRVATRFGTRITCAGALALAALGLPLMLTPSLQSVLAGMVLLSVGTFFAQAVATGFVGRAARADRASASGTYLACYFLGGLAGSVALGQIYDRLNWTACVAGIGLALLAAVALTPRLRLHGAS
jgi:MFS transporter, YNFM family, putative membrane transport protein